MHIYSFCKGQRIKMTYLDQATTGPKIKISNPTNYMLLDSECYADNYSKKDYTLKSNC